MYQNGVHREPDHACPLFFTTSVKLWAYLVDEKKKKKKKVQQISVNTEVYMSRVIFAQTLTTSLLLKPFHLKEFHLIKTLPLRDRPRRI